MKRIILGDGILGSEIQKQTGWDYISRKKDGIDFINLSTYTYKIHEYDEIINCIGSTDTYSRDRDTHWYTNYVGVEALADYCSFMGKKLVHISTDYIYADSKRFATEDNVPCHRPNWYSYTKLLGDACVQMILDEPQYLLIRTSFKERPFKYPEAFYNLVGNFDYVDVIADLIIKLIEKDACGIFNVGTENKNMFWLAKETRPDVIPTKGEIPTMPHNVSMNISKMKRFLDEN